MLIDGDDFLYPYCLKKLEKYINYNPDILFLPWNDILSKDYQDTTLSYPINDKCYLNYNNFLINNTMHDTWINEKISPFINPIYNCNTPCRLFVLSKKGLNLNLYYDENLKLYDDFHVALQLLENTIINEKINIYGIYDSDLFLYNRLNNNSATTHFFSGDSKNEKEEMFFRQSIYNKFLAIRDWNLNKFKFLRADPDSEFPINDKIKFCKKLIENLGIEPIKIKKDNFLLFKKYAINNNNKEMLDLYNSDL